MIFNKWEPTSIPIVLSLLVAFPTLLSSLLFPYFPTLQAVGYAFATYFFTIFGSMVAYRISPFHPLAQYPGPLLCKISKFWMVSVVTTGKQHLYIQSLHNQYGDVVRVGEQAISSDEAG